MFKIEYIDGSPMFHLEGRAYDNNRPFALREIQKVGGVERPPVVRASGKQEPSVSVRKIPIVAPKKARLREKTTVASMPMPPTVQRTRRIKVKTSPFTIG